MSAKTWAPNKKELERITDILMGAAHSDGDYDPEEAGVIGDILAELVGGDLSPSTAARISGFEPEKFDLNATGAALVMTSSKDRRALMMLVAKVVDADGIHDFMEDEYIMSVAKAIGAKQEEYEDLTAMVMEISTVTPPPPPPPPGVPSA
jgi:uncharacterized tellurite resistance protein B-like protein